MGDSCGVTIAFRLTVRVRIVKQMAGVLDGVSLGHLEPGLIYDVDQSLGASLVSTQSAEEVSLSDSPIVESKDDPLMEHVARGVTITNHRSQPLERVVSHDRPRKRRRRRR